VVELVETERVAVAAEPDIRAGLTPTVRPVTAGALRVTSPIKPLSLPTVIVEVSEAPGGIVRDVGLAERV
jgi:hypothetical protein